MDVVSDVLAIMRTGQPRSALLEYHGPWGRAFPASPGSAGFKVVLQGSSWLIPGGGEPIALNVGDVAFLPHGNEFAIADSPSTPIGEPDCPGEHDLYTAVSFAGPGPATVLLSGGYQLDAGRVHPIMRDLPEVIHLPARLGHRPELRAVVDLLGNEISRPSIGADTAVSSLLDMLLLYILRAFFDTEPEECSAGGWAGALTDPGISAALDAIHRDPALPWTVQSMGERAQLSRAAFSRRFTALIGQPPLGYLTWWRLSLAGRLLRESDLPVGEVAGRVGYTSEFAFANAFKREYGMPPGKYRRHGTVSPHPVSFPREHARA